MKENLIKSEAMHFFPSPPLEKEHLTDRKSVLRFLYMHKTVSNET